MRELQPPDDGVQHFSTEDVPTGEKFGRWMEILSQSLWKVTEWTDVDQAFDVNFYSAKIGCISTIAERISAHRSRRTKADVEKSQDTSYHLFVNLGSPWAFSHRGFNQRLDRGDLVMLGKGEHETIVPNGFNGLILKCPEHWIRTWLPEPDLIVGQAILNDSSWGQVLSPAISELSPQMAAAPLLPHSVLVDQLGALLAIAAGALDAKSSSGLEVRILDCIRQRCSEPQLSAADVAASLNVPAAVLHRALRAAMTTFATALVDARVEVALSLLALKSPQLMSTAEIARRAGFLSESSCTRALLKRAAKHAVCLGTRSR